MTGGKKFQSYIISAVYTTHRGMAQLLPLLSPNYFEFMGDRVLLKAAKEYFDKYRKIPSKEILYQSIDEEYHSYLRRILKRKVKDLDILIDDVKKFVDTEKIKAALYKGAELIDSGKLKEASVIIRKALAGDVKGNGISGSFAFKQLQQNLIEISYNNFGNTVPTGFYHLDNAMGGGLCPGELGVVMARLKLGKSFWLLNVAYAAASLLSGVNVVFYSLENSRWKTLRRFYRRMLCDSNVTMESMDKLGQLAHIHFPGDIWVQQFPTGSVGVSELMGHLDYLIDSQNFKPGLVIVDYADCLKADRGQGEKRFELNAIFEDLRKLAGEFNVPVWTATQTRRLGFDKKIVQADDSSESIGKPQIADVFLTMSQDKDDTNANRILLNLAAMRDSPGDRVVVCNKDYSKSLIYSVGVNDVYSYENKDKEKEVHKVSKYKGKSVLNDGQPKY